jgi:hypothetical protein
MNVAFIQVARPEAPTGPDPIARRAQTARPTTHACLRYAQRVLGMTIDEDRLMQDAALRGRCARGIGRLLERASCARRSDDAEIWVARTRALVVKNSRVLTILVAPKRRGSAKWLRPTPGAGVSAARTPGSAS